jgi:hypothetical protein
VKVSIQLNIQYTYNMFIDQTRITTHLHRSRLNPLTTRSIFLEFVHQIMGLSLRDKPMIGWTNSRKIDCWHILNNFQSNIFQNFISFHRYFQICQTLHSSGIPSKMGFNPLHSVVVVLVYTCQDYQ